MLPQVTKQLKMKIFGTFFIVFVCILNKAVPCSEKGACYSEKMKILLDSASSFLKKAQDLTDVVPDKHTSMDNQCPSKPMDCEDILFCGNKASGSYEVWPRSRISENTVRVYCDMATDGGGWTVFQRRGAYGRPTDYFFKDWISYKTGFGKVTEDFWLGNDNIYALTNQRPYSLRIDMRDLENNSRYAAYDNFWIDGEEYKYTLHVRGYTGDAGDSFAPHSGWHFTTKDRDNDSYDEGNCAQLYKGGWWYGKCHASNLNGLYLNGTHTSYANGVEWSTWKHMNYSLPFVDMKIRPFSFSTSQTEAIDPQ